MVCDARFEAKYLKIDGFELQDQNNAILTGLTEQQCIETCSNNRVYGLFVEYHDKISM